jgi:pimeloyl-ACP methyl ester carboxylesterase
VKSPAAHLPRKGSDQADWLTDVFAGLGIQKPHVVGLSFGGLLTLHLAIYAPERVNRTVVMSPALFMRQNMGFSLRAAVAALMPSRRTVHGFLRYLIAPQNPVDEGIVEGMRLTLKYQRLNLNIPAALTDDLLRRIQAPTLFLVGEYEVMYAPLAVVERAKRLIPNVQAEIVRNAGHALNLEQPETVNSLILNFLAA